MCRGIGGASDMTDWIDAADVLVVGPGLGRSVWSERLAGAMLAVDKPLVLDADGLNYLAANRQRRANWVLTPHPGEAGRLLGRPAAEVQRDRLASLRALRERFGGVAVLKGAGTLIAGPGDVPHICLAGNAGMAAAGMGDVLTGVIAALRAQGLAAETAAIAGVTAHAAAGDRAAARGMRGLMAGDLIAELRGILNPVSGVVP
jgi:NAD(P)H-hydrate epimerase